MVERERVGAGERENESVLWKYTWGLFESSAEWESAHAWGELTQGLGMNRRLLAYKTSFGALTGLGL
jgi:hypothetical protein